MRRYELFINDGTPGDYASEWRCVGSFEAPKRSDCERVAAGYLASLTWHGPVKAMVFPATNGVGKMVCEVSQ